MTITIAEIFAKYYLTLFSQTPIADEIRFLGWRHCIGGKILASLHEENIRDYENFIEIIHFIDKIYLVCPNNNFLDILSKSLFNIVFIPLFQEQILMSEKNTGISRTSIQFLILILENINSKKFVKLIFNFLFGFFENKPVFNSEDNNTENINEISPSQEYKFISHYKNSSSSSEAPICKGFEIENENFPKIKSAENSLCAETGEAPEKPIEILDYLEPEFLGNNEEIKEDPINLIVSPSKGKPYFPLINVKEYNVEKHAQKALRQIIFEKLKSENNNFSVIYWELLDTLLKFNLPDFIKLIISNKQKINSNKEVFLKFITKI